MMERRPLKFLGFHVNVLSTYRKKMQLPMEDPLPLGHPVVAIHVLLWLTLSGIRFG